MEHQVLDQERLTDILTRHGLIKKWKTLKWMRSEMKKYPEVTELFKQKAQRRRRLARLSFEEKIAVVNRWRKLSRNIRKSQSIAKPSMPRDGTGN